MTRNNLWTGVAALGVAVGSVGLLSILAAKSLGRQSWIAPFCLGYAISAALAVPSYLSLLWALKQSDKVFYGVFVGGIFFRLIGFSVTALITHSSGRWPLASVMLPLVFGLVVASFIEMYFIQKEARA